jgi:Predicted phosphohydrolase (DHH superfamily)
MSEQKKDVVCFYHANCTDGAASAAVIHFKYPQTQSYPVTHGDPFPVDVSGKTLFIVDFSFDAERLSELKKKAKELYWYDHHKTSLPILEKLGWGDIDLKESGASLTWKREFPQQPVPKILEYVRDKDLFEWRLPQSREISMELKNIAEVLDPKSEFWQRYLKGWEDADFQLKVKNGEVALRAQKMAILTGLKNAFEVEFHGHRGLAVNWSLEASDIGEYIYKELGYPLAILFYYSGKNWTFSLRSNKIDVSELALKHGGGGHPGAAGFRHDSIDWFLQMKTSPKE